MSGRDRHAAIRAGALLVLLVAWGLLVFRLNETPPGFQHDQTFSALDAMQVVNGHYPIYFPDNFGRGPLFMYSAAGVFLLTGGHYVWSLHFTAVIWGMLGLAATISLARRYLPAAAALFAAGLMGGSFWFLLDARLGVESVALVPLALAMFYFLDRGMARRSLRDLAAAGVLGGIANYTYLASRTLYALPLVLLVPVLAAMLRDKRRTGRWSAAAGRVGFGLLLTMLLMLVVSGPLLAYLAQHQGSDGRIGQLSTALNAALRGDLRPMLYNTWDTVRSILWRGTAALPYFYNIPGRPLLPPILAAGLLIGLGQTLVRLKSRHEFLLLAVLALGLAANFLTGADALYMRAVYAMPILFTLTARGVWAMLPFLRRPRLTLRWPFRTAVRAPILQLAVVVVLLLWHGTSEALAYFNTWSRAEPTQRIYNADFRAAAAYLDTQPDAEPVYMGTDRLRDLDSLTYGFYEPRRTDIDWYALPDVPPMPATGEALYLLPTSAQMPATLAALAPIMRDRFVLPAPDGGYDLMQGFRLSADDLTALLNDWGSQPLAQPVIFGDALRLDAAGLHPQGEHAELVTSWTVLAPWPRAARPGYVLAQPKLSVSLTDDTRYRWSQDDLATALPVLTWAPGQRLLEITPVTLPSDLPPGAYQVRVSMYDDEQGPLAMRYSDLPIASPPVVASVKLALTSTAPAPTPPFPLAAASAPAQPLRLLGRWEALNQLIVGLPATVHLSWQAAQTIDTAGLTFEVRARTADGRVLWEQPADPMQPLPAIWPAGQVWRLTHLLTPSTPDAGATPAALEICARLPGTADVCGEIGQPTVMNYPPVMALPAPPQHPTDARWADGPALAGYDLAQSGETITLTLYWQAGVAPAGPIKRFVHAVGADQTISAQSDAELQNHGIPAASWRPGEYVADTVTLALPAGQAVTTLYVGLYSPDTGERLPVTAAATTTDDNRVVIQLN